MIAPWKSFAEANGNILVAPTLPFDGTFETAVALQLYPMMMDAARREWNIDPRRMYLFGVSAGGYKVFDASMFDSRYFAAGDMFARNHAGLRLNHAAGNTKDSYCYLHRGPRRILFGYPLARTTFLQA